VARILGIAAGAIVLLVQLLYWLPNHATRDASSLDVPGYFVAARHVLAREPLYAESLRGAFGPYIYPPPFAVVISPLALLGPARFQVAWYAGILISFWLYAAALVRLSARALSVARILTAGALLQLCPGTSTTMSFGNADLFVWALCALSLCGRSAWAGVAAAVKIYPGWTLLTRPKHEALLGAAAAASVLGGSLIVVGVRGFVDWFAVARKLAAGADWHTNVSVSFRLVQVLGRPDLSGTVAFVATAGAVWLATVMLRRGRVSREVAGSLVLVAAMALAPVCWIHYAPALLIPAAARLRAKTSPPT
jgi:hypothetical protein